MLFYLFISACIIVTTYKWQKHTDYAYKKQLFITVWTYI